MTLPPKIRPFLLKFDENLHNFIHVAVLSSRLYNLRSVRKKTRAKNEKLFTVNVT